MRPRTGQVTKTANGTYRWRVQWREGQQRLTARSETDYATKAEAQKALRKFLTEQDNGAGPARRGTLGEYLHDWIETYSKTGALKHSTLVKYRQIIDFYLVPRLGNIALRKLTAADIERCYADLLDNGATHKRPGREGLSPRTVHHIHAVLNYALRTAVRRGDLPRNVCELVNKPKLQAPAVQAWTSEQVAQFLTTAATTGDPLLPVWVLLTAAPLRRSELCGLRWGDIDLVEGVLRVERTRHQVNGRLYDDTPKSERSRRVLPLTEDARWALAAWKNAHAAAAQALGHWATDRVMTDVDGNEITPNGLYKRFQAARKRAGLPAMRLHSTRSTFGTNWLHQGRPLHQLSALLGHANAGFTLRTYAPVMPSQTAESVAQYGSALRDLLDIDLAGVLGANRGANRAEPGTSTSKD